MQTIFIAGCGYIGGRIARISRDKGIAVTCMVRSREHADSLESEGFGTVVGTLDDRSALPEFAVSGTILFYLVPPPGGGTTDTRVRNFLAALGHTGKPLKIIYVSATSVYSETRGGGVTERSPTLPVSAMGKRRLDAEAAFMEFGACNGVPVVILRVSGIYGPGRLPVMQIRQGQPLLREEESGPSNRIHADDLADICMAAAEKGEGGEVFNISDGAPSSMTAYFNACADALGEPRQPQVTMDEARRLMSPLMFSYVSESRVVDITRMTKRLGISLRYPTLTEGLKGSIDPGERH